MSSDEMLAYAKVYSDVADMHELNLSEQPRRVADFRP